MIHLNRWRQVVVATLSSLMWTSLALAQENTTTTNGTTSTTTTSIAWYGNWWVWAVGVAVFLIVVIALTNRGGRSNV